MHPIKNNDTHKKRVTYMLPSETELTYFYEIALSGSFSKAAARLSITQPSLSMAIKRLEKSLGTELFYRNSTGVTLTRAGEKLLPQIEDLLSRWNNIKQQVTATHHAIAGRVTIGCHLAMSSYVGPLISYFLKTYPGIEINLVAETSDKISELVIGSSVDIGIVVNPLEHPEFVIKNIIETDFTFWHNDHRQTMQRFNTDETVIIYDPQMPQAVKLLKQIESDHRFSYARLSRVNGMENVANLAAHDCGIAILPACFVKGIFGGKLQRIHDTPFITNKTCLIYRHENKRVLAVKTIVDELRKHIKENFS